MDAARSARNVSRISHIINVLFKHGLGHVVDDLQLRYHLKFWNKLRKHQKPDNPEVRFRKAFEDLGGTFIKLGQLLSIRPDLVPVSYTEELSKLQDQTRPFSKEIVESTLNKEIGQTWHHVFKEFDFVPLSSASIGQVHKAILKNGTSVVVKVMRPRIRRTIESDLDIMHFFAKRLSKHHRYKNLNIQAIVDEFEFYSKNELDYRKEAKYIDIFYNNFKGSKTIVIPKVYFDYTTSRILTMQFIKGDKIRDMLAEGKRFDKKNVIHIGIDALIQQIFDYNVFHADLHPGNLLMLPGKKVALLDFGIVGVMNERLKKESINLILSLSAMDFEGVANVLLRVGTPSQWTNKEDFRREVSFIINEWYGKSLSEARPTTMLKKLFEECIHHGITMPRDLILIGKAAVTLEGTCQLIDPDFDFSKEAIPYLKTIVKKQMMPKNLISKALKTSVEFKESLVGFPSKLSGIMDTIREGKVRVDINETEIKEITTEIGHSTNRLAVGMILVALIISGTVTVGKDIPPMFNGYPLVALLSYGLALVLGFYFFFNRND